MSLPKEFVIKTKALLGNEYPELESALNATAPTSIRMNNKRKSIPSEEKVPWCDDGFYLPQRPIFTADPTFHGGAYYVQEASSMFLSRVARQHLRSSLRVLDLCAAPGGKSTLLLNSLPDDCLLVCNEIIRSRASILYENIVKWGNSNAIVSNNSPKDFARLPDFFDAIIVDAPCSGEGMFRKNHNARNEWSPQLVNLCVVRQREIVENIWGALKTGGILVYSTCTFNREENEENVRWIAETLGAELLPMDINGFTGIVQSDAGFRFYPHRMKGEGFFITALRKTEGKEYKINPKQKNKTDVSIKSQNLPFKLRNNDDFLFKSADSKIKAFKKTLYSDTLTVESKLNCFSSGILLGEQKGSNTIPSHQLALCKDFDSSSVATIDVDYTTAIRFLKRETIEPVSPEKGYVLIRYEDLIIGWVKNLGNRCNNLYPTEWRIRMNIELKK